MKGSASDSSSSDASPTGYEVGEKPPSKCFRHLNRILEVKFRFEKKVSTCTPTWSHRGRTLFLIQLKLLQKMLIQSRIERT